MNTTAQLSLFERARGLAQREIAVAAYRGESFLLSFLYIALGVCIMGYVYFVGVSIVNLIANREAVVENERLQSEVASLEQEYFELSKGITAAAAAEHGLSQPAAASFVRRDANYAANVTAGDL